MLIVKAEFATFLHLVELPINASPGVTQTTININTTDDSILDTQVFDGVLCHDLVATHMAMCGTSPMSDPAIVVMSQDTPHGHEATHHRSRRFQTLTGSQERYNA